MAEQPLIPSEKKPDVLPGLVEVTVTVDNHIHQGLPVAKGEKISVTPEERDWLAGLPTPVIKK